MSEPPPPPPGQWQRSGGSEDEPPPPPQPGGSDEEAGSQRVRGLAGAGVFVVVVAAIVAAAALLAPGGEGGDGPRTEQSPSGQAATTEAATRALQEVLGEIDRAERSMIEFQRTAARAARGGGGGGSDAEATVREAAEQAVQELQRIREQLTAHDLEGEELQPVQATRDAYVEHLDAWVDRLQLVADNPSRALGQTPDPGAFREINQTAQAFADQLRSAVPEDAPEDLRSLARLILERGFSPGGGTPGGQLV